MTTPFCERPRAEGYFPLPDATFEIGLCAGELAVYVYLMRCENRTTHQCRSSCRTSGAPLRMSENTAHKYVCRLGEKEHVTVEPITAITRDGQKRNGNSRYTICHFRDARAAYHRQKLDQLETQTVRQRTEAALAKRTAYHRRCEPPCAPR